MTVAENLLKELVEESVVTRKMLARIPADKYEWQPHEKSMTMKQLAGHIAELPGWATMAMHTDELDFAAGTYTPPVWNNGEELLAIFEDALAGAEATLAGVPDEALEAEWLLRNGEQVLMRMTKSGLVRHAISQTIHHRAQLGVYLRLLNVAIPGTYGPSADEPGF